MAHVKESPRPGTNETGTNKLGQDGTPYRHHNSTPSPASLRINLSKRTEVMLDFVAEGLASGAFPVYYLPCAIQCIYWAGHEDGVKHVMPRLKNAEYARDQYYEQAHNPGKTLTNIRERRFNQAAERWEHVEDTVERYYRTLLDASTPEQAGGQR